MLEAIVVRKRKQEAVPAMYVALIKNETLANILLKLNFIREEKSIQILNLILLLLL